jgi:NAD(P)-dependent dehydrogenase (short-subunit alcohol dehydrogenase family)
MQAALAQAGLAPDILVLCASIEIRETWDAISDAALSQQSEINLHATVRLIKTFLPGMLARGFGRIIAIGSVQEARPHADCLYYAASKAAQTNMILNLARTVRSPDVTFNVIKPGAIATERNRAILARPGNEAAVRERIPLGRIGAPQDCVGAALLLCSPDGGYINGAEIAVDGGMRL